MNEQIRRGAMLMDTGRIDLAEVEFRKALAGDPEDGAAHALLALCLLRREKLDEAEHEAREAVRCEPVSAMSHGVIADVLIERNRFAEALPCAEEARRLDPMEADNHARLAGLHMQLRDWSAALGSAELGLEMDPVHVGCNNLRAAALVKLGRRDEAGATIREALSRDPENPATHANSGWALLHGGDHLKAAEHFRESLRLDPGNEWARAGIVESLKARNPIYAIMLRWFLWMGRLRGSMQWVVILCIFFGQQFLGAISTSQSPWAPVAAVGFWCLVAFVLLTWAAEPAFNLLLRLDRFGRHALSEDQINGANAFGACIAAGVAIPLVGWWMERIPAGLFGGLMFGMLGLISSGVWQTAVGWPRTVFGTAACVLGSGAAFSTVLMLRGDPTGLELAMWTLRGLFLSTWLSAIFAGVRPKR